MRVFTKEMRGAQQKAVDSLRESLTNPNVAGVMRKREKVHLQLLLDEIDMLRATVGAYRSIELDVHQDAAVDNRLEEAGIELSYES